MPRRDPPPSGWRKSPDCEINTCVEIAVTNADVWLRNSTRPEVAVRFTADEWRVFRSSLELGHFDDLEAELPFT